MFKKALIMNKYSYAGREYLNSLFTSNINIDVIRIGDYNINDLVEDERCENKWFPPLETSFNSKFKLFSFKNLNSVELMSFLDKERYDYGIQGGTGIINEKIIKKFKYGILNFHPGDLPYYRGCSAPEWQLNDKKDIICTSHFIDKGIDSGKILFKKKLKVNTENYSLFRASIYPEISKFVKEVIEKLELEIELIYSGKIQNEKDAVYRKIMKDDLLIKLKNKLNK